MVRDADEVMKLSLLWNGVKARRAVKSEASQSGKTGVASSWTGNYGIVEAGRDRSFLPLHCICVCGEAAKGKNFTTFFFEFKCIWSWWKTVACNVVLPHQHSRHRHTACLYPSHAIPVESRPLAPAHAALVSSIENWITSRFSYNIYYKVFRLPTAVHPLPLPQSSRLFYIYVCCLTYRVMLTVSKFHIHRVSILTIGCFSFFGLLTL